MTLTRRGLIAGAAGAAATATLAASACGPDESTAARAGFDPASWDSVRAQFRLTPGVANFATFVFASHPEPVRAAIERHRAGLDADPYGYLGAHESTLDDAVLAGAAGYLRTSPGQVALTDSTTMGLGLLYTGLRLSPGDEVLTTEHDFYSTHESLRLRAGRDGATVRRVRLYDEPERASADEMLARLRAALTPRTRVVAVTWVHSSSGVLLPIRAMADAIADANAVRAPAQRALLCVDGVHGFGVESATPAELGCDFLVSGCHKWLFGPRGTGLVWGSPAGWDRYTPVIPPFARDETPGQLATPGGYHSFEHRWALAEAFAFRLAIGATRVAERTHALTGALLAGLGTLPKVRLRTPATPALRAGIVCCEVEGYSAREAVARLRGAGVWASATPYDPSYLRFGASVLTTESDVDRAVAALRAL